MGYIEFLKLVDMRQITATEKTLRLWHVIYEWISQHGYADTADTPEFIKHMNAFRKCSISTLGNHLRRMASTGLLKRNVLRRKLPPEEREELSISSVLFTSGIESLPTTFVRYCLPGHQCSIEFKSAEVVANKINNRIEEFRASKTL